MSHIFKNFNCKYFRIKNLFNEDNNFIFSITDSFKGNDMLKIISHSIRFDYEEKLFFSIHAN